MSSSEEVSLVIVCLATSLSCFFFSGPIPLVVCAILCLTLFRVQQLDEDEKVKELDEDEDNTVPVESKETYIRFDHQSSAEVDSSVLSQLPLSSTSTADSQFITAQPSIQQKQESINQTAIGETGEDRVRARLSEKQLEMAHRLIARLKSDPNFRPDHPVFYPNLVNARRYLQARNWNETVAEELWRKAVNWRINYKLGEKRAELRRLRQLGPGFDPAFDFAEKHWFVFKTGRDKHGTPGIVIRAGTADPYGVIREVDSVDSFIARCLDTLEEILEDAIERDVLDYGLVEIADVREYKHVPHYFSRAYNSLAGFKPWAHILDEVYVERVRKVIIIGAPAIFMAIWNLVLPIIPKETKKKIVMTGANHEDKWVAALKNEFPDASIPQYMGGSGSNDQVLEGLVVPKNSFSRFMESYKQENYAEIGIISDVQHADANDGTNFDKTCHRRYRLALEGLKRACEDWKAAKVDAVIQAGDLIDGVARTINDSERAVERCIQAFSTVGVPVHHVIGNHDLYNFDRPTLSKLLNGAPVSYRSTVVRNYRVLFLDAYEITVIGGKEGEPVYEQGKDMLLKGNPNDFRSSHNWLAGLHGTRRRFVAYNGAVTPKQLAWLESELTEAIKQNQLAIIVSHIAVSPRASANSCLVWNYKEILSILHRFASVKHNGRAGVALVLAGHDHSGGYGIDEAGIHHLTLKAPLEAPGGIAHGILRLGQRGMTVKGWGQVKDRDLPIFQTEKEAEIGRKQFEQASISQLYQACVNGNYKKSFEECAKVWHEFEGSWECLPQPEWPRPN